MPSTVRRVHVFVRGRVQGVSYRASAQARANTLGLAGWVRNLADGRVELVAEGAAADVARLLDWARRGPARAEVASLACTEEPPAGERAPFVVRR